MSAERHTVRSVKMNSNKGQKTKYFFSNKEISSVIRHIFSIMNYLEHHSINYDQLKSYRFLK